MSTNVVTDTGSEEFYPFEPSSAYGGGTWAITWTDLAQTGGGPSASASFIGSSSGGAWSHNSIVSPYGLQLGDLNVAYDSTHGRFVYAAADLPSTGNSNVWFWYFSGGSTFWQAVFSASVAQWDYPSVSVDSTGRIIVGAGNITTGGYYVSVSTNGGNSFGTGTSVSSAGINLGNLSRVVAAGSTFYVFVPVYTGQYVYSSVQLLSSTNGVNWSSPTTIASFLPPANQSPNGSIYYAADPQVQGYSNGLWTVVFQVNNNGYNNAYICTSNRGCGLVNAGADDEFVVGTSVSGDGGYWVYYYTYSTLNTRSLPLITQAIYFPPNSNPIGATTFSGIDPSFGAWIQFQAGMRCPSACYAAGDYNNIASNPSLVASMPVVTQDASDSPALYQQFLEDPQAPPSAAPFTPNFVPYPMGADLSSIGQPLTPNQYGVRARIFNRHGKNNTQ